MQDSRRQEIGVWAPAGTPADIIVKLCADFRCALASPELRDWMVDHGADPLTMTQPEFAQFVECESERATRVAKAGSTTSTRDTGVRH